MPFDSPFFLLAASREQLDLSRTELMRIGYDRPVAVAGSPADVVAPDRLASYPTATFAELAAARRDRRLLVLDVRRASEWSQGRVGGARHVPLPDLPAAIPALPDVETWVYCASGFRAAIAASVLQTAGRGVVLVDDQFDA